MKNHDKGLVIVKGQLNMVQHENQNLSNNLIKVNHATTKIKNRQQKYVEVNQPNWTTHHVAILALGARPR